MSEPFLGEIKIVSFGYAPKGWVLANGQTLPINQNQALFSLFGTMYGGNGQTTFALPNLQGLVALHVGGSFNIQGQSGGAEAVTLKTSEMPQHIHVAQAVTPAGNVAIPAGNMLATSPAKPYDAAANLTTLTPATISNAGGSQAHENRQPYLAVTFIVALQGIFPSQN